MNVHGVSQRDVDSITADLAVILEEEMAKGCSPFKAVSAVARRGASMCCTVAEWEGFLWCVYRTHLGKPRRVHPLDLAERSGLSRPRGAE